jgi:hypothetical protein
VSFNIDELKNIPDEMRNANRWLLWKSIANDNPSKKARKVPYYVNGQPRKGILDSPEDMANFGTIDNVILALQTGEYAGPAFALGPDGTGNYWQGGDIDKISKHPELISLVEGFKSYTESSPSGDGYHIIGYGRDFTTLGSNSSGVEAYNKKRYFTVTGQNVRNKKIECIANYVEQEFKPLHDGLPPTTEPKPKTESDSTQKQEPTFEWVAPQVLEHLESALKSIDADDYHLWIKNGIALKTLGDTGLELFIQYSKKSVKYDANEIFKVWHTFKPTHTSYKAIFAEAQRNGWVNPNSNVANQVEVSNSCLEILEHESSYVQLDLLKHLAEDSYPRQITEHLSAVTDIPPSTILMLLLSTFSGLTCTKWSVVYLDGTPMPLGIYVCAQQPSGTSKSRLLDILQKSLVDLMVKEQKRLKKVIKQLSRHKKLTNEQAAELDDTKEMLERVTVLTPLTDPTPESLQVALNLTNGFINLASSEKGLLNSVFGLTYGGEKRVNNNDVILNGYDAGKITVRRVTREGYAGPVIASISCFVQQGCVEDIIALSKGTGLAERFEYCVEEHSLGKRNHLNLVQINWNLLNSFHAQCHSLAQHKLDCDLDFDELTALTIQSSDWTKIAQFQQEVEPQLADSGLFSSTTLRGSAAKLKQKIMKIAANLHILEGGSETNVIDTRHIDAAIAIERDLLRAMYQLCKSLGVLGSKAEYETILNYLGRKPRNTANINDMLSSLRTTKPFFELGTNRRKQAKASIEEMIAGKLLIQIGNDISLAK